VIAEVASRRCRDCGAELAPALLACPACRALVHGEELRALAAQAGRAAAEARTSEELAAWRRALELLPEESRQHAVVAGKVAALSRRVDGGPLLPPVPPAAPAGGSAAALPAPPPRTAPRRWTGGALAALALLLWKGKALLVFLLGKGKLLALGLSKSGTVFTMLLSFGVYWTAFGWPLALGLVLSIYVHEMGHVAALQRFGIRASWPMFVPGLGAVVRLRQRPATPQEDARVGLAGPLWGLGAALAAWGAYAVTGAPIWGAIARLGAWINLFNLLPVWQLDGGRAFRALSRPQRFAVAGALAALWWWSREGLLLVLLVFAGVRAVGRASHEAGDRTALLQYLLLAAALTALTTIHVAVP
jgi:Zn-dependent protease